MSDESGFVQILAKVEEAANATALMRMEIVALLNETRATLSDQISELVERQAAFLADLGKTRIELMARMQSVRDDVTVKLEAARVAEKAGRRTLEQSNRIIDALAALTLQVQQLQARVDAQDGKPAA